ncbi:MAG: DUF6443 domain-containing protein [Candidatus Azobacteroides sp.]|nr:DUF6443 domain-containing protein [Candidatus Azobacteroides sp.]
MKKYIILFICCLYGTTMIYPQTSTQNYIRTRTMTSETGNEYMETIRYFDGLGRPVQEVMTGFTPGNTDLVTMVEYDMAGREYKSWLPMNASTTSGIYRSPADMKTRTFLYGNDSIYSRTEYEHSPLGRVTEEYGPGKEWYTAGRAVRTEYLTNVSTEGSELMCERFVKNGSLLFRYGAYASGELSVTKYTDEDRNVAYEFTDKLGQVILTRQMNGSVKHDTYYLYDNAGNRVLVMPPMLEERCRTITSAIPANTSADKDFKNYAYLYYYDKRNQCVQKKLPGCDFTYYVYDRAGQLVLSQDGNQRRKSRQEWTFYKYDALGRLVISGIWKSNNSLQDMQSIFEEIVVQETPSTSGVYKYTWNKQPKDIAQEDILLVNYYDHYTHATSQHAAYASQLAYEERSGYGKRYVDSQCEDCSAKGMLTASLVKMLDGNTQDILTLYYYDEKGQPIQVRTKNHLNEVDKEFVSYNFTGQLLEKLMIHGKGNITEKTRYEYDHAGRLIKTWHQMDSQAEVLLAEQSYDQVGRLGEKKLHDGIEAIAYSYNTRGWLTRIESPRFRENISYLGGYGGVSYYNGNIASIGWKVKDESSDRGYTYRYDGLNRMTKATYRQGATQNDNFSEELSYDKHGNILTLSRRGRMYSSINPGTYALIDKLTYSYEGNQVRKIVDDGFETSYYGSQDFKDGVNPKNPNMEYLYDTLGNMVTDYNKRIAFIEYNLLNLPKRIQFEQGHYINYMYDAAGNKCSVESRTAKDGILVPMGQITELGSSDLVAGSSKQDYVGHARYQPTYLSRLYTAEGFVARQYGMSGSWVYTYQLRDHLGSVRYTFKGDNTDVGFTHYYPFGMEYSDEGIRNMNSAERFTGHEFQTQHGLNVYDQLARMLNQTEGRFWQIDPLAEKRPWESTYAYCGNNPVNRVDPDGLEWMTEEDKEFANSLSQAMTKRINSEQKNLDKLNDKIAQNQAKGKNVSKDQAKATEMQANIDNLQAGISELTAMGETKEQVFTYNKINGNIGGTEMKDGVIIMDIADNGAKANGIHESSHGYDLWKNGNYTKDNYLSGEVKAYSRQFSFDKNSVPTSDFGRAKSLSNINGRWILGINDNGNYLYIEKLRPGENPKDILKFIK